MYQKHNKTRKKTIKKIINKITINNNNNKMMKKTMKINNKNKNNNKIQQTNNRRILTKMVYYQMKMIILQNSRSLQCIYHLEKMIMVLGNHMTITNIYQNTKINYCLYAQIPLKYIQCALVYYMDVVNSPSKNTLNMLGCNIQLIYLYSMMDIISFLLYIVPTQLGLYSKSPKIHLITNSISLESIKLLISSNLLLSKLLLMVSDASQSPQILISISFQSNGPSNSLLILICYLAHLLLMKKEIPILIGIVK